MIVSRTGGNYYPQVILEECKYVDKKKMSRDNTDKIEISSDSNRED